MTTQQSTLPRSAPEAQGIQSANLEAFLDGVAREDLEVHSLMVVRNDHVVAEGWWHPFQAQDRHLLYSLSKSFLSTAVGFAVQEGFFSIEDPVIKFFPDKLPEVVSENLAAMKVKHLLSMSCGHAADDMTELYMREDNDWMKGFLQREVPHVPGTVFLYNSSASYALSAIISVTTGKSTLDFLKPRFLDPLGIDEATWESCPNGYSYGGWGMSVKTESIAKFGQFYLHKGMWNGVQLLPEAWIEEATKFQVPNDGSRNTDWEQGYGYQFWRCRYDAYRGDGAFGQFCVVVPEKRMVVATTSAVYNMQALLDLIWEHIVLPVSDASPELDELDSAVLRHRLGSLTVSMPAGSKASQRVEELSNAKYASTDPQARLAGIAYAFSEESCTMTFSTPAGEKSLQIGRNGWIPGESTFDTPVPVRIAACGAWENEDTFVVKVRYLESPSGFTIVNRFGSGTVEMTSELTCRFTPPEGPTFSGILVQP